MLTHEEKYRTSSESTFKKQHKSASSFYGQGACFPLSTLETRHTPALTGDYCVLTEFYICLETTCFWSCNDSQDQSP